jgi:hypothetical protein
MYGTTDMYGTDHSKIFSEQVNNKLYSTQYNVGTGGLAIQCMESTAAASSK